ncbi:MAG: CRISPR-associated protein Cst2 [Thermococcaceae archaeon]|nr:CRISPR-associated protein Cst2 [Kosmotoga sp.]MDN5320115.1 CRISPR-associated protein Cst2 [Thermococcaceae archaeon]
MSRFLVMDVVFYGSSLNYDQGSGNYQELKKITRWDGRQYTVASRYALRYSLLETGRKLGLWKIAEGDKLARAGSGDNTVIQPATELLLSGEILKYPEFDLFGYLITSTTPQNFRSAPVKLSHAVSMTPFNYDALFNANLGLANRMRKVYGEMKPNPFTAEEHETFYQYSIVVDIDEIGKADVFITLSSNISLGRDDENKEIKMKIEDVIKEGDKVKFIFKKGKDTEEITQHNEVKLETFEKINKNLVHIRYSIPPEKQKERLKNLIRAVLNLKRSIKGREEDLRPRLLVLGIYKNAPYQTFKDRIELIDEYSEEEYDEIEEREEDGKKVVKIKHVVSKSKKPIFRIAGLSENTKEPEELDESKILSLIDDLFNSKEGEISKVVVFKDPSIEVKLE